MENNEIELKECSNKYPSYSYEKRKEYRIKHYLKNPNKLKDKLKKDSIRYFRLKKTEPWKIVYWNVKRRIKNDKGYKHLDMSITLNDVKDLWYLFKAWEMKRPSIDRMDNSKGYHFWNCQFIELSINSVKDKKRKGVSNG
jgi:hypothetical protein